MRWLMAGVLFALAVLLTVGTAALRAENVRLRRRIEVDYRLVQDRIVELRRLGMERLHADSPQRLAELHWHYLQAEAQRGDRQ